MLEVQMLVMVFWSGAWCGIRVERGGGGVGAGAGGGTAAAGGGETVMSITSVFIWRERGRERDMRDPSVPVTGGKMPPVTGAPIGQCAHPPHVKRQPIV